jgi:integrase
MSISPPSRPAYETALASLRGTTLQDVLTALAHHAGLAPRERTGLVSAVRRFCKGLGRQPSEVPAEPRVVRDGLDRLTPAGLGITRQSYRNLRSQVVKALGVAGIDTLAACCRTKPHPEWQALLDALPDERLRYTLSRPIKLLSAAGILPGQMDQAMADALGESMEKRQVLRQPRAAFTNFIKAWNRARALVAGWPDVELHIEDGRRFYVLPQAVFPTALIGEMEAWLQAAGTLSLRRRRKPLRPATIKGHRVKLFELASAAVHGGVPAAELVSLEALIDHRIVERALTWLAARFGGQPAPQLHSLARLACGVGRALMEGLAGDELIVAAANLEELKVFESNLRVEHNGLAPKNRELLKRLNDPDALARFLTAPRLVLGQLLRKPNVRVLDAARAEKALAYEILLHAPARIENIHQIKIDTHLKVYGQGKAAKTWLIFPAIEVKNGMDLAFQLPADTADLIAQFRRRFRPLLANGDNAFLFAGRKGGPKQSGGFSMQIAKLASEQVGFRVTAHQFRHACAFIYLKRHPGDYETVRRFLGHKKIETTIRFYCGMEAEAAVELWTETLAKEREVAAIKLATRRRRRR